MRDDEAVRREQWIRDPVPRGGHLLTGGGRERAAREPAIVVAVQSNMRVSFDERFRPAVGLKRLDSVDEAIASTNDTNYGLSAVTTGDLDNAARFAKEVDAGNTQTNSQTH